MKWVESLGGPLIVIERNLLGFWEGNVSKRTGVSDYDRACGVNDYIGPIKVGIGTALILGEEPMPTTWVPMKGTAGGLIIRWVYASSDDAVANLMEQLMLFEFDEPGFEFAFQSNDIVLFDAAFSGKDKNIREEMEFSLEPKAYRIRTAFFEPNPEVKLLLHKFD